MRLGRYDNMIVLRVVKSPTQQINIAALRGKKQYFVELRKERHRFFIYVFVRAYSASINVEI